VASSKKAFGKGRSPTRFSFTYEDFAQARGCSIEAARKHAQRGNFNPKDLMSVLEFIQTKLTKTNGDSLSALVEQARNAAGGDGK
jgi:hypothetical protein